MPPKPLERILYVEDDDDIREVVGLALEVIAGFQVLLCGSGEEALREAVAFVPDLIVLDAMMPEMDGPATLRALRAIPSLFNVPVVFITAKVQPSEVAGFLGMGAVDVVAKPFDPMTLGASLRTIWSRLSASPAADLGDP